jgi:hypothetical protein
MTESICDVVHPFTFNDTRSTNAAHRVEDYKLELRYDVDPKVSFARSALLEHHPLTKFPETWHEFPDLGSMVCCLIALSIPLQLSLDITSNNLVFTLHTFLYGILGFCTDNYTRIFFLIIY